MDTGLVDARPRAASLLDLRALGRGFETVASATSSTADSSAASATSSTADPAATADGDGLDARSAAGGLAARPAVGTADGLLDGVEDGFEVDLELRDVKQELRTDVVEIPTPEGGTQAFEVRETQVMEPGLAAEHPELKTYAGQAVDDPSQKVVVDVTPLGLSASVRGSDSWVVDPADTKRRTDGHVAYRSQDVIPGVPLEEPIDVSSLVSRRSQSDLLNRRSDATSPGARPPAGEVQRRTYRLALLNDPTYAKYFGTENVLAQKVTLVNRVNQVYNDDHGIRFLLVGGTEHLNLDTDAKATGPNGPCGSAPCFDEGDKAGTGQLDRCGVDTIGRTRLVLGNLIGAAAYDVGHLVLGVDGGGVAYLGVAGQDYAGSGCTGLTQPRGDFFYIDYVAHELGHQFGANHTFDGSGDFCGANGSDASVEPGSGSSVMAYAGICGPDDLQPHTDPYFSQRTMAEVSSYVRSDAGGVVEVQQVSLSGFDSAGDTVTIGFDGQTRTLTRGQDYTRAGVQKAVADLTGEDVRIAGWGYDPILDSIGLGPGPGRPSAAGFQVVFADSYDPGVGGQRSDLPELSVTGSEDVTARVSEVAQGGDSRNGGTADASGNRRPTVTAPADATIPVRTPFRLEGSATDADGDALTYLWEQNDPGVGTALTESRRVFGPLFRVFSDNAQVSTSDAYRSPSPGQNAAGSSPVRYFPDLAQVLRGQTNAATGSCPRVTGDRISDRVLDCYSELLPTKRYRGAAKQGGRTMHFRLTARDGDADGGGTSYDDVAIKVKRTAGPFLVTSQDSGRTLRAGQAVRVRWDVNRTQKLARKVRIRLSTDNGRTWDTVLARNTRNDGKKRVTIPAGTSAGNAWVMVEARGNYFFDVNDEPFRIR